MKSLRQNNRNLLCCAFTIPLAFLAVASHPHGGHAGDWPQTLGPDRNGKAVNENLRAWQNTPTIRWKVKCGAGYAGVAVSNDKVYLWHRENNEERLDCLNTNDGTRVWRARFEAVYRGGVDADRGPRCVPLVSGDRVFVYGAAGDLSAIATNDGATLWSRQLRSEYDADDGYFGAGSSPLLIDNVLITPVGGSNGAGLIGIDAMTGKTLWKTLDQEAAYASPIRVEIDNQIRAVAVMRLQTAIIVPASGKVIGTFAFGKRGPTVNAATPIEHDGKLLLTASYGIGCRMLDLTARPLKNIWDTNNVIGSQYVTPVLVDQQLYAITGREDFGTGELRCVRWSDGKVAWSRPDFGTAQLLGVNNTILAQHVDGQLELFAADPDQFRSLASFELPPGIYRAFPALADGTLYCRRNLSPTECELLAIDID
ncbi:MAG: PQQ-binding-like beta-propeller repeat protein [Rhodopirellula sp. JB053]|uniref:outer membrane protein assembly factor BamB family protein n=1 Tax=Rhodopirellula sp. JB044 TaxID=3342844 RepID=UPI003709EF50